MGAFSPSPFEGDDDSQGAPWQNQPSSLGSRGASGHHEDQRGPNRNGSPASSYGAESASPAPTSRPLQNEPNPSRNDEPEIVYARPVADPRAHGAVSQQGMERPSGGPHAYFTELQRRPAGSASRTNVLAIASLLCGIFGLGPVAVVFGHVALSQIKRTGEGGRTFVTIGLTLGYLGILAWAALVTFFIVNDIDLSPLLSSVG